jgi:putative FmdB family regulatory protein
MPVYEFRCIQGCENYEVWRSIQQRTMATDCPSCGGSGERVFTPPMTLSGTLRLKVENKEPKVVRKEAKESAASGRSRLRENTTRPWMVNRGC